MSDINWFDGALGQQLWQMHNDLGREVDSARIKAEKERADRSHSWSTSHDDYDEDDYDDYDEDDEDDYDEDSDDYDEDNDDDYDEDDSDNESVTRGHACYDCVFYVKNDVKNGPGRGCMLWELQGWIDDFDCPDVPPDERNDCSRFQHGRGFSGTCYDCIHWKGESITTYREDGCKIWSRVQGHYRKIRREKMDTWNPDFPDDHPYMDRKICIDFKLNKQLEPGYGQACVREVLEDRY